MWFRELMGFYEEDPDQVRANINIIDDRVISNVNQKEFIFGHLEILSLKQLISRSKSLDSFNSNISVKEVIGNIQDFHKAKENNGAFFQAASQFNLLEMASPSVTPERGVGIYEGDYTQGPACAVACGSGTIYRNYFVPVNGKIGQTANNQINCLDELGEELGNQNEKLWRLQNGYLFTTSENLQKIIHEINKKSPEAYEKLKRKLKIGIQWNTEVTLEGTENIVTQAYCSALPIRYNDISKIDEWESFARLILEATYEATFYAALQNFERTGNNKVFLTLVGGGVFGNNKEWIMDSIKKSIMKFKNTPLDIRIVSYNNMDSDIRKLIQEIES